MKMLLYAILTAFQLALWVSFLPIYFEKNLSAGMHWLVIAAQTLVGSFFIYELSLLIKYWGA